MEMSWKCTAITTRYKPDSLTTRDLVASAKIFVVLLIGGRKKISFSNSMGDIDIAMFGHLARILARIFTTRHTSKGDYVEVE